MKPPLLEHLSLALEKRISTIKLEETDAVRLFNGYIEGFPSLIIDIFHHTLVIHEGKRDPHITPDLMDQITSFYCSRLPQIECVVNKKRHSPTLALRRGRILHGRQPAIELRENGVCYAIDLLLQQDDSFYLDNRGLRGWLAAKAKDWQVLNTFAYTGSLGIAALAGGAARVFQTDRNPAYLNLARKSLALNGFDPARQELEAYDFFKVTSKLRALGRQFDAVILDPPFFATSASGRIDLQSAMARLINKVRPLVKHASCLIVINNSLFLSGQSFLAQLESLTASGFLRVREMIPVAHDCAGFEKIPPTAYPADPSPFNHPTKIVVLDVLRKNPRELHS